MSLVYELSKIKREIYHYHGDMLSLTHIHLYNEVYSHSKHSPER